MKLFSQDGLPLTAAPDATRWALLIGINKYPFLGEVDLDGSVNDALGYKAVLQERFDFPEENITILLDDAATHDTILNALDRLVAVAQEGDQVVLSYSGHGRRIANPDSHEADQMDETFVPSDSGSGFYPNRDIRDDEFLSRIVALTERGAFVTFFCDCCHSSASLRDDFRAATRGLAADLRRQTIEQQQSSLLAPPLGLEDAAPPVQVHSPIVPRPPVALGLRRDRYVYVAACRDSELATEHIDQTESGPQVHGALSYYLQRELASSRAGETMGQVIDRAFAALSTECPEQHPRAEGALQDAPLFVAEPLYSQAQRMPGRFEQCAIVRERSGKTVELSVGRLHGETQGSRYAVYAPGFQSADVGDRTPLGLVEVTAVRATTLRAKILVEEPAAAMAPGCLAVEWEHSAALTPLLIEICCDPEQPDLPLLTDAIERLQERLLTLPAIAVVADRSASLRLYALAARGQPSASVGGDVAVPSSPVPQLGALFEPVWALVGRDGRLRAPPLPLGSDGNLAALCGLLASLATQQLCLRLTPRASGLRDAVFAQLWLRRSGQDWQPVDSHDGSLPVVEEGDELSLSLSPRPGFADELSPLPAPLHVAVLYQSASGEVRVWASASQGPPQVLRSGTFQLGRQPKERLVARIAPGYPPTGWDRLPDPRIDPDLATASAIEPAPAMDYVQDLIQVFLGTRPLQAPLQAALRVTPSTRTRDPSLRPEAAAPARWLAMALRGRKLRRRRPSLASLTADGRNPREAWTVIALPLIVRRRLGA